MSEQIPEHRRTRSHTATKVLEELDFKLRHDDVSDIRSFTTGFDALDDVLGGGMRAGDLVVLAGPPGVGKTIAALQWARHVARTGAQAIFVCYEHEPALLLLRLLALELGENGYGDEQSRSLVAGLLHEVTSTRGVVDRLQVTEGGASALEGFRTYADNLLLVRASGSHTTLEEIEGLVSQYQDDSHSAVLFIDYLQKIPLHPEPEIEAEKVTRTVEGVKDLALSYRLPVVLLSAVDSAGMQANRLRLHHLRGSSAIAFESDVVVMLNSKEKAVSKVHLTYDPNRARGFRDWTVMSIEKNRGGPNLIDLEFRKDFSHFRFDPEGGVVTEKLVSERLDEEAM